MSSLTPNHKFLLDENVKTALARYLKQQGFSFKLAPKTISDSNLALLSLKEKRILVTNDEDFQWYSKEEIYAVIWLWIPQDDTPALLSSFGKLLKECRSFAGKLIVLDTNKWRAIPLPITIKV